MSRHAFHNKMRSIFATASTIALFLCLGFFSVDKICLLHEVYTIRSHELEKERWLLKQCKDPEFFSNLGYHTSLCTEIEGKARIGALWYAINQVSCSLPVEIIWETLVKASWPLLALLAATFLLFPSVVVAYARGSHYPQDECSRLQYNKQLAQSKYPAL